MKRLIPAILLGLLLCVGNLANGQDFVFKVLASKGTNQVKGTAGSNWVPVKAGVRLNDGDQIKVSEDAYLGLVHASGKTVELRDESLITVNELAAQIKSSGSNVVSKYADFVPNRMDETEEERESNLRVTGAVTRAAAKMPIKANLPLYVDVMTTEAMVKWTPVEGEHTYVVVMENIFDEEIVRQETTNTQLTVDLKDPKFSDERLIVLEIFLKEDESITSAEYGLKPLSGDDAERIEKDLNELDVALDGESSINQVMKAAFFEENNLLMNASSSYEKAIELSPDVKDFQEMYDSFIERNRLY